MIARVTELRAHDFKNNRDHHQFDVYYTLHMWDKTPVSEQKWWMWRHCCFVVGRDKVPPKALKFIKAAQHLTIRYEKREYPEEMLKWMDYKA